MKIVIVGGTFNESGGKPSGYIDRLARELIDPPLKNHVAIYANGGHAWMTIDGRRFDTVALQEAGSRWSSGGGEFDGFIVRPPVGF